VSGRGWIDVVRREWRAGHGRKVCAWWARADPALHVAAAVAARVLRLFAMLVDGVPLGAGANASSQAATPDTAQFACTQALLVFARDALGLAPRT